MNSPASRIGIFGGTTGRRRAESGFWYRRWLALGSGCEIGLTQNSVVKIVEEVQPAATAASSGDTSVITRSFHMRVL